MLEEAVAKDDFTAAKYLGELAWNAARRAREADLTKRIVARNKAVNEMAEAYSEAEVFFQTLKANPVDPDANLAIGKYYCFMKGDWDRGIAMLALGSDTALKTVATIELDGPTDVNGQIDLGDGWWGLAETKDDLAKERLRERAAVWYRLAAPKLSGLLKSKIEKRINEVPKDRLARMAVPRPSKRAVTSAKPPTPPSLAVAPFDAHQAKQHQQASARYLGVPVEITNSIGMKLVLIPPGEFDMGSTQEEVDRLLGKARQNNWPRWYTDRLPGEAPRHRVRITRAFYLGVCEVTQAQYVLIMGSNPSHFEGPSNPVEQVSWEDATEFCGKLSAKEGRTFRLPTEAEWEFACRGGTAAAWCFGDNEIEFSNYAWCKTNARRKTHTVGQKKPNAWGLYDIHGNVYEWCQDWYDEDYYAGSPTDDPPGPSGGSLHVDRGGSWGSIPWCCRSSVRDSSVPSRRIYSLGFRVAAVSPSK